jgi:hypothetical protein
MFDTMKALGLLILIKFFTLTNLYSQDINRIKDGQTIPKGNLTLKDGQIIRFNSLTLNGKRFIFNDKNGSGLEKDTSDVYNVKKRGSYAGYGALGGGLFGLLICLTISAEDIKSQQDAWGGLPENIKVRPSAAGWLITTSVSIGIGALLGACFSKNKVYYEKNSAVSIYPSVDRVNNKYSPLLTLKINLK